LRVSRAPVGALLAQVSVRIRARVPRRDSALVIFRGYPAWARAGVETQQLVHYFAYLFVSFPSHFSFPFLSFPLLSHTRIFPLSFRNLVGHIRASRTRLSMLLYCLTLVIQHRYPLFHHRHSFASRVSIMSNALHITVIEV